MRSRVIACSALCAALACATGAVSAPSRPNPDLFNLVVALDAAQPFDIATIEKLIGQRMTCSQAGARVDCDAYNVPIGNAKISRINFRQALRLRGLLILEGFGEACLSVSDVDRRFGPGELGQSCTDGAICNYQQMDRPWGKLSMGITDAGSVCAHSVVMNSGEPR